MKIAERRRVELICRKAEQLTKVTQGTAHRKEVVQMSVSQMRASLRRRRFRQAEDVAYGIIMECTRHSDGDSEESDASHETSKTLRLIGGIRRGYRTKYKICAGRCRDQAERDGRSLGHFAKLSILARKQQNRSQPFFIEENFNRVPDSGGVSTNRELCGV